MKHQRIKLQFMLIVLCITLLQTVGINVYSIAQSRREALESTQRTARNLLEKSAELADMRCRQVVDIYAQFNADLSVYQFVINAAAQQASSLTDIRNIQRIFNNYFGSHKEIRNIHLLMQRQTVSSSGKPFISYQQLVCAPEYTDLSERGRILWIRDPTQQVFHMIRRLNMSVIINGEITLLPRDICPVYLVADVDICFLTQYMPQNEISLDAGIFIYDGDQTIYSSVTGETRNPVPPDKEIVFQDGAYYFNIKSDINPWVYQLKIPESSIYHDVDISRYSSLPYLLITLVIVNIAVYLLISRSFQPIQTLANQSFPIISEKMANIDHVINEAERIQMTIDGLNLYIDKLTRVNNNIQQREQEAHIMMLESQINPHYIYNALNRIYLRLLEQGNDSTAKAVYHLARMTQFSLNSSTHFVYLYQDIEMTQKYVELMHANASDDFTVLIRINPVLMDCIVPKMLTQPFMENAILHGISGKQGGIITVNSEKTDNNLYLFIEDNGVGVSDEEINQIRDGFTGHIGSSNVNKRIQLLFGEEYGVQVTKLAHGTRICIHLPYLIDHTDAC